MKTAELDPNKPAAQQAATAQPAPTPKEKTKEDLAAIEEFTDKLLGRDEESKKKDAEKEAAKVEADKAAKAKKGVVEKTDEEKATEAAAAEAKKKKAAKPAASATTPAVDVSAISQAVADGIRAATTAKTPDKPAKPADDFELPADEKRKVAVLERMEADMPEKYKGRAKQYVDQLKAAEKYAADWERKNPGRAFDDNDPEHAAFFDAQDADWDDADFRDTETAIAAEKLFEKRIAPINDELKEWKREKRLKAEEPNIEAKQDEAAVKFWKTLGDDFGSVVKDDGSVDSEAFKSLEKSDPIGAGIALRFARNVVNPVAAELYKLENGLVDFNPNPRNRTDDEISRAKMHSDIVDFATQEQEYLLARPEKWIDGAGRKFATKHEWDNLTEEQRKGRWFLNAERLTQLWAAAKAKAAREFATIERENVKKYAGAYAGKPATNTAKQPEVRRANTGEDDDTIIDEGNGKPSSPSITGAPTVAGTGKPGDTDSAKKVLDWALG